MAANTSVPAPVYSVEEAAELAAETGHAPTNEASELADAGSAGLPQFEFQHWGGQAAYLLILFAILYVLIAKVFAPRLRRVLDERAETISTAIAAARSVQDEAAAQAAAAKAELEDARSQSRATAVAAKQRVTDEARTRQAEEEAKVTARIDEAEAAIARSRDAAMTHVSAIAADTTRAMVERLTGKAVSAAEAAAAVKGAV